MHIYNSDFDSLRSTIESEEEWHIWAERIPDLQFDSEWKVRIVPPFAGVLARFLVTKGEKNVSVFLDGYARLGAVRDAEGNPVPYYEIYPAPGTDDVKRYHIEDTEELLADIRQILED